MESNFTDNIRTSGFNTEAGTPEFTDKGGIAVSGATVGSAGLPGTTNGNTALLRFWDVIFADNLANGGYDVWAVGTQCEAAQCKADPLIVLAGTDNHVLVQLRGLTASIGVEPPDPSETVTVVRIY